VTTLDTEPHIEWATLSPYVDKGSRARKYVLSFERPHGNTRRQSRAKCTTVTDRSDLRHRFRHLLYNSRRRYYTRSWSFVTWNDLSRGSSFDGAFLRHAISERNYGEECEAS